MSSPSGSKLSDIKDHYIPSTTYESEQTTSAPTTSNPFAPSAPSADPDPNIPSFEESIRSGLSRSTSSKRKRLSGRPSHSRKQSRSMAMDVYSERPSHIGPSSQTTAEQYRLAVPISSSRSHVSQHRREGSWSTQTQKLRQRTAVACSHCRRRKIRCSGFDPSVENSRCSNCIRLNQECIFTPVSGVAAAVTTIPPQKSTEYRIQTPEMNRFGLSYSMSYSPVPMEQFSPSHNHPYANNPALYPPGTPQQLIYNTPPYPRSVETSPQRSFPTPTQYIPQESYIPNYPMVQASEPIYQPPPSYYYPQSVPGTPVTYGSHVFNVNPGGQQFQQSPIHYQQPIYREHAQTQPMQSLQSMPLIEHPPSDSQPSTSMHPAQPEPSTPMSTTSTEHSGIKEISPKEQDSPSQKRHSRLQISDLLQ